jgi:hypothetical protein
MNGDTCCGTQSTRVSQSPRVVESVHRFSTLPGSECRSLLVCVTALPPQSRIPLLMHPVPACQLAVSLMTSGRELPLASTAGRSRCTPTDRRCLTLRCSSQRTLAWCFCCDEAGEATEEESSCWHSDSDTQRDVAKGTGHWGQTGSAEKMLRTNMHQLNLNDRTTVPPTTRGITRRDDCSPTTPISISPQCSLLQRRHADETPHDSQTPAIQRD